jgi:hypothetical protein
MKGSRIMTEEQVDQPLALEVKWNATGLSAKVKSRAASAVDRLIGSFADRSAARVEGDAQRIRLDSAVQQALTEVDAQAAIRQLAQDPRVGQRAINNFFNEQVRKQENRDAVAVAAVEELKQLPTLNNENIEGEADNIDDDWLNMFGKYAENASSDRIRKLWGRILAGEIRQQKSFSLTTIRAISEIDNDIAESFQTSVASRLLIGWLPKSDKLQGQEFERLLFLEEVGLLQDVSSGTGVTLTKAEDGYMYLNNGQYFLRIKPTKKPEPIKNDELRIPLICISRVGREIASIFPLPPHDEPLRQIAKFLPRVSPIIMVGPLVESVELCKLDDSPPHAPIVLESL